MGRAIYEYNEFNQTTKVETFDGNIQINRYDAEGLRYEMEENGRLVQFIFNTNREVIAEKEHTWTSYIRTSELIASSNEYDKTFYHYASDEMGSITHIAQGIDILNQYEYDAWGEVVSQTETVQNRFKFNGQQLDPITQQYYLRARYYNPVIARFTQEDTYKGDGLNLYAYCRNNPVMYVDPSGHESLCNKKVRIEAYENQASLSESDKKNYTRLYASIIEIEGNRNSSQLWELREKIIAKVGDDIYYETMIKINFGAYLDNLQKNNLHINKEISKIELKNPHAHHIVYKKGSENLRQLVESAQEIILSVKIDPIISPENLILAPNTGHSYDNLKPIVDELKVIQDSMPDFSQVKQERVIDVLRRYGEISQGR
ncbi:MAG: hypothetical protein BEN19_07585 [Epulopiscium sp. Nuni2H_MBin003]|nr:MAG: hypothetical protein BEN19_07585 [Epulopiscium sp. Nuni2H_MBin003]